VVGLPSFQCHFGTISNAHTFTCDTADLVTNLREEILTYRLRYSLTSLGDEQGEELLDKAFKAIEK
jgi:hypothetical protein